MIPFEWLAAAAYLVGAAILWGLQFWWVRTQAAKAAASVPAKVTAHLARSKDENTRLAARRLGRHAAEAIDAPSKAEVEAIVSDALKSLSATVDGVHEETKTAAAEALKASNGVEAKFSSVERQIQSVTEAIRSTQDGATLSAGDIADAIVQRANLGEALQNALRGHMSDLKQVLVSAEREDQDEAAKLVIQTETGGSLLEYAQEWADAGHPIVAKGIMAAPRLLGKLPKILAAGGYKDEAAMVEAAVSK